MSNINIKHWLIFSPPKNVRKSVKLGTTEHIQLSSLSIDELKEKLLKVLTDPIYAKNAAIRSQLLRDQPEKPIDRATWWIEYVLRNVNVSHIKSPVMQLGFIRGNSLDLYAIVLIALLITVGFIGYSGWWLFQVLYGLSISKVKVKVN